MNARIGFSSYPKQELGSGADIRIVLPKALEVSEYEGVSLSAFGDENDKHSDRYRMQRMCPGAIKALTSPVSEILRTLPKTTQRAVGSECRQMMACANKIQLLLKNESLSCDQCIALLHFIQGCTDALQGIAARIAPQDNEVAIIASSRSDRYNKIISEITLGSQTRTAGGRNGEFVFSRLNPQTVDRKNTHQYSYHFDAYDALIRESKSTVVFPGGYGTLLRTMYLIQLMQVRHIERRPLILYGKEEWQGLNDLADAMLNTFRWGTALISPADKKLWRIVDSVDELKLALREECDDKLASGRLNPGEREKLNRYINQLVQLEWSINKRINQLFPTQPRPGAAVFGSARFAENSHYYNLAMDMGRSVIECGYDLFDGGGPGAMEGATRGAMKIADHYNKIVHTLPIVLPFEEEQCLGNSTRPYYKFPSRLHGFDGANVFINVPGGFGTLFELVNFARLAQTESHIPGRKPLILLDDHVGGTRPKSESLWHVFDQWIKLAVEDGRIPRVDTNLYEILDSVGEVETVLREQLIKKMYFPVYGRAT